MQYQRLTFKTEKERDVMFDYLGGEKGEEEDKIQKALDEMYAYLGSPYKQDNNRTEWTEEGTSTMDCSELVSRFIYKVLDLEKTPTYTTQSFLNGGTNIHTEFIPCSNNEDYNDIKPGDIFLWKTRTAGHVGVVISYDLPSDQVKIIESITTSAEEIHTKKLPNYCTKCIRISVYSRTGKALYKHDNWKGYFRIKTK